MPSPVSTVAACLGCPIRERYPLSPFVPPKAGIDGPDGKGILTIGEKPGADEGRMGEPFVGASGHMLNTWMSKIGLTRQAQTISNVVSCYQDGNLFPTDADKRGKRLLPLAEAHVAVKHCIEHHLTHLLASRSWSKIYLIGAKALQYLTGKTSLFDWGGTPLPIPALGEQRIAVATMHPAAFMRDATLLPLVYADLQRPLDVPQETYAIYPDPAELLPLADSAFALDIETDIPPSKIRMFSASARSNTGLVLRWDEQSACVVAETLRRAKIVYLQNGIQFDLLHLRKHGAPYNTDPRNCSVRDTMLMHHLLWPTLPHDLGTLGRQYLTKPFWKKWTADSAVEFAEETYACRDADGTYEIGERLWAELGRHPKLKRLYERVQVPLARICSLMTEIGILTDPAEARKLVVKADTILTEKEALLPDHMRPAILRKRRRVPAPDGTLTPLKFGKSGKPLKQTPVRFLWEEYEMLGTAPWRNSEKTAKFLYEELGLKQKLTVDGRVTTGKLALAQLFHTSKLPAVEALRDLRRWASRKNICEKLADTETAKRLHASFNVHGTNTGRLSCSGDENKIQMQNQTGDLRVMFVPSQPGWVIWSIDFSQMEARLAAWFAKDTARAARFDLPGYSEYKHAASVFLGVRMEDVRKDKAPDSPYHRAKTIVLGTDRALGAKKISINEDIPEGEVRKMQAAWKSQIPATIAWQESTGNQGKRDRYLYNPFGRRGIFYTSSAYTEAISFLPQSTGADVIFRGMIALMHERIEWPRDWVREIVPRVVPLPEPARLLLQIHDELVGECPESQVPEVAAALTTVLEQPWPELNGLALPTNFAYGHNWWHASDEETSLKLVPVLA